MIHLANGKRLSECVLRNPVTVIAVIPLNGMFPPLDLNAVPSAGDMVRPLQQVTLRPDQFSAVGYLRLGNTPGDEAHCWIAPLNVQIVEVLGRAYWDGGELRVLEDGTDNALEAQDLRKVA